MNGAVMEPLTSWWQAVVARQGHRPALAGVCLELAARSEPDVAAFLAGAALDLTPDSAEALALLERSVPARDRRVLWPRYEAFLASDAPPADMSDVRQRLIDLLFDLGHAYSALTQVDQALDGLMGTDLSDQDVERAYRSMVEPAQPPGQLSQLAVYLSAWEQPLLADAAE